MTLGYLGIGAVLLIGIAVVTYGWLADRADTRRREQFLTSVPERPIPGLADVREPAYLTQDELLHGPRPDSLAIAVADIEELKSASSLPFGHAAAEFENGFDSRLRRGSTDEVGLRQAQPSSAHGFCVLHQPRILVSEASITAVREVMPAMMAARTEGAALVIVVPAMSDQVMDTVRVNVIQGKFAGAVVLVTDAIQRSQLASMVGATPLTLADLRAGYLPPAAFGSCETWVSSRERIWLVSRS